MTLFWPTIFSRRTRASTRFSDFIRYASAGEKKKVYTEVLKKATERQNEIARKARPQATKPDQRE